MKEKMNEEYYSYIKKWFKKESGYYHILVDVPSSRLRDKFVNIVNAKKGSRILDVATGTGGQAFAFARKGYDVVGVDLSEDMVKVANSLNRYKNLKFRVADATSLPFENNYFDVCCICLALHDMPLAIRMKALEEMVRVIKPKGTIAIFDYGLPKNKILRYLVYYLIKSHETKYYPEFIKSNLKALLRKHGIKVEEEIPILGFGKILICLNEK